MPSIQFGHIRSAFRPDLIAGPAVNTEAGVALVEKLTGVPAMDARAASAAPALRKILEDCLTRPPDDHRVGQEDLPMGFSNARPEH